MLRTKAPGSWFSTNIKCIKVYSPPTLKRIKGVLKPKPWRMDDLDKEQKEGGLLCWSPPALPRGFHRWAHWEEVGRRPTRSLCCGVAQVVFDFRLVGKENIIITKRRRKVVKVTMKMNCLGREEEQCSSLRAEWAPAQPPGPLSWCASCWAPGHISPQLEDILQQDTGKASGGSCRCGRKSRSQPEA